jgi:putative spermidine/putrescine transport system ATP-binding protein
MVKGTVRAADEQRCGIVLPDGRVLTGVNVNGAAVGGQVEASIRPERIVLHRHAPTDKSNALQASVSGVIYYGDHLRLLCKLGADQAEATVKVPLSSGAPPHAGDAVWLEFPPELTRIYTL